VAIWNGKLWDPGYSCWAGRSFCITRGRSCSVFAPHSYFSRPRIASGPDSSSGWTAGPPILNACILILIADALVLYETQTDGSSSPLLLPSLFFVGAVVVLFLWRLPALQVARSKGLTDENRFDRENEARKTLAQILAGVFLFAGLYSSVQTLNLSRDGQTTDRFTKAIEQLGAVDEAGNPKRELRLGGIYSLERIARDSERDYSVIMEILTTYVREYSPLIKGSGHKAPDKRRPRTATTPVSVERKAQHPDEDIQVIVTVLGRRRGNDLEILNLSRTDLSGTDLSRGRLDVVDLSGADLRGAVLSWADLHGGLLAEANLSRATLTQMQIDVARGDPLTQLPTGSGLRKPASWLK
jgi:hypothetical protein